MAEGRWWVWALWALAALAALALWNVVWVLAVRRYYRPRTPPGEEARVRCADGWELAVHARRATERRFAEPVLLCHGLAANRYTFDFEPPYSLAHALAEAGFDCFTVEWRGTGRSRTPPRGRAGTDFTVDDHVRHDGPALLDWALRQTGAPRAFWVGHSLGGLIGYGVAQGHEAARLAGLVALGSPVFFKFEPFMRVLLSLGVRASWRGRLRQEWASAGLAPFLGYLTLPLSDLVANARHIPPRLQRQLFANMITSVSRKVLLQFQDWITHDALRSFDRTTDWRAGIGGLRLPLLVLGGSADRLAPPQNVHAQAELARAGGAPDVTEHVFGTDRGDRMDYGHGDLLFGEGAPREVYPVVRAWLEAHATPVRGG